MESSGWSLQNNALETDDFSVVPDMALKFESSHWEDFSLKIQISILVKR